MITVKAEAEDESACEEMDPNVTTSIVHDEEAPAADDSGIDVDDGSTTPAKSRRSGIQWSRVVAYGLLPGLALALFVGAGYLKWIDTKNRDARSAAVESVQAARDSTISLLSYTSADVDEQLVAVRDRLTGQFRDAYTSLTDEVVIPGSKQQQITAVATVPAASSVSADANHAVVMVFVNQTTTMGTGTPTDLASTVRVTLDRVAGRWLISQFDPV